MKTQLTQAERKLAAKQNIDETMLVLLKEETKSPIFTDEKKVLTTWFLKPTPRASRALSPSGGGIIVAMPPHCIEAEKTLNSALKYLVSPFRAEETIRSVRKILRPFGFSTYCLRHQELITDNNPKVRRHEDATQTRMGHRLDRVSLRETSGSSAAQGRHRRRLGQNKSV